MKNYLRYGRLNGVHSYSVVIGIVYSELLVCTLALGVLLYHSVKRFARGPVDPDEILLDSTVAAQFAVELRLVLPYVPESEPGL